MTAVLLGFRRSEGSTQAVLPYRQLLVSVTYVSISLSTTACSFAATAEQKVNPKYLPTYDPWVSGSLRDTSIRSTSFQKESFSFYHEAILSIKPSKSPYYIVRCALPPTILALWQTPALNFSPVMISRFFMAYVWIAM